MLADLLSSPAEGRVLQQENMRTYKSNDEFFQALEKLVQEIDDSGQYEAANRLREGFSCLNGLTDGWALLMESIETTVSQDQEKLKCENMAELKEMLKIVRKAVYRR